MKNKVLAGWGFGRPVLEPGINTVTAVYKTIPFSKFDIMLSKMLTVFTDVVIHISLLDLAGIIISRKRHL